MKEANELHLLGSVSKLSSGRHPSLLPDRLRYAIQVKAPLTFWRRVDIPRSEVMIGGLKDKALILALLYEQFWVVSMPALEFNEQTLSYCGAVKGVIGTLRLSKIGEVVTFEIVKEFLLFH